MTQRGTHSAKNQKPARKKSHPFRRLVATEAHHRLTFSALLAVITFCLMFRLVRLSVSLIASWDVFALSSLALAWMGILFTDAKTRVREANLQDSSRTVIAACVILAALAGLAGAGVLMGSAKGLPGVEATKHIALAGGTVVCSWLLVHTILSLHYTHVFYAACRGERHEEGVGLAFPGEKEPDFLDFAYFSFVIGMTCQVSDVQITSRRIRRIALVHGLLSFVFNTVILAFTINLASSLL